MLDEKFHQNASKFVIHRPWHSIGKKLSSMKWKMEKVTLGFDIHKICQILKHFTGTFHQA